MKHITTFLIILIIGLFTKLSFSQNPMCLTDHSEFSKINYDAKSINILKTVRINYHFMLRSDGSGNFTETNDNQGNLYSGYDYAFEITNWMNGRSSWNQQMNLPSGNATTKLDKKYRYVLDAVHFHRDDNFAEFQDISPANRIDGMHVLNIFITINNTTSNNIIGYASTLSSTSSNKYTDNTNIYESYVNWLNNPNPVSWGWFLHGSGSHLNHELCHLFNLSHTVRWNDADFCGTGCSGLPHPQMNDTINPLCDDGCTDTPTAWEITQLNSCSQHPACGWYNSAPLNGYDQNLCTNNLMDYSGENALTPCQINRIHASLEGGMHTYLLCTAVQTDQSYTDIGYPRISYYGRNVDIGDNSAATADVTDDEQLTVYFSESVELRNFEVKATDADFEVKFNATCTF